MKYDKKLRKHTGLNDNAQRGNLHKILMKTNFDSRKRKPGGGSVRRLKLAVTQQNVI